MKYFFIVKTMTVHYILIWVQLVEQNLKQAILMFLSGNIESFRSVSHDKIKVLLDPESVFLNKQ